MPHLLNVTKGFESVCLFYSPLQPIATQSRRREGEGEANFRMIINKITLKVNLTLSAICNSDTGLQTLDIRIL